MRALTDGPGIVVFKRAFGDLSVVDRATEAFLAQIAAEKAAGATGGDHFAKPGANDRVWGALDKLAVADPAVFADYYANDIIALVSEAWLGPNYQVTSQVNVVNPGGQAQTAHRDYHLGFMDAVAAARFPAQVHRLSPALTLQGAVAHCDMPVETGPTLYLPYSHQYEPGYLAFHLPEFTEYFQENYTQLAAGEGRCRLLQPRPVPRCRHERLGRRTTDGQPAAGVLAVRPSHGDRRPGGDVPGPVPGAAGEEGGRRVRRRAGQRHRRLRRGLRASRPTSTGTSRSTASRRRRRPTWSARRSPRSGRRRRSSPPWTPRPRAPAPARVSGGCPQSCSPPAGPTPVTRCRCPVATSVRWTSASGPRPWPRPASPGIGFTIDDLDAASADVRAAGGEEDLRRPRPGPPRGGAARELVDQRRRRAGVGPDPALAAATPPRSSVPDRSRSGPNAGRRWCRPAPDRRRVTGRPSCTSWPHRPLTSAPGSPWSRCRSPTSPTSGWPPSSSPPPTTPQPVWSVDIWHLERGPSTLADLAGVPGDKVFVVELNDAPAPQSADLVPRHHPPPGACAGRDLRRPGLRRHTAADRLRPDPGASRSSPTHTAGGPCTRPWLKRARPRPRSSTVSAHDDEAWDADEDEPSTGVATTWTDPRFTPSQTSRSTWNPAPSSAVRCG